MCEGKKIHMMERIPASPTVIYVNVDTPSKVETTPVIKGNMAVRSDPDLCLRQQTYLNPCFLPPHCVKSLDAAFAMQNM